MPAFLSIEAALTALAAQVASPGKSPGNPAGIIRLSRRLEKQDLVQWLLIQPARPVFYWRDREGNWESVSSGAAWQTGPGASLASVAAEISRAKQGLPPGARLYGGLRFSSSRHSTPDWNAFPDAYFFLPRVELLRQGEDYRLHVHYQPCYARQAADFLRELAGRVAALLPETGPPPELELEGRTPGKAEWSKQVERVQEKIAGGELRKLVLARCNSYRFSGETRPLLRQFLGQNTSAHYRFLLQTEPGSIFLGATPERLFQRDGDVLFTEAVAGTRPRGDQPAGDRALEAELLQSEKDVHEHALVWKWLRESLIPLSSTIEEPARPTVLKLDNLQHLYAPLKVQLQGAVDDIRLLRALHPTPAVGGMPRSAALQAIPEIEIFDRGWYAGPIGWIAATRSEFAVAIRSALLRERKLFVFTGAGIVGDSRAEKEWQELNHKENSVLTVFGLR